MSAIRTKPAPPTDLELMLYFDDELEEPRHSEVEEALAEQSEAARKLAAMDVVGQVLRNAALGTAAGPAAPANGAAPAAKRRRAHRADGIADAVMARIAAGGGAPHEADSSAGPRPLGQPKRVEARPANDNARTIFALSVLAVAAAAGMMIWGKLEPAAPFAPAASGVALAPPASAAPVPAPAPEPERVEAAAGPEEPEVGVEVAAVDFGARSGSVFYVPTEAATTTVVWIGEEIDE